jgi:chemotaxis signal transduction protein
VETSVQLIICVVRQRVLGVLAAQVVELLDGRVLQFRPDGDLTASLAYRGQEIRVIHLARWLEWRAQKTDQASVPELFPIDQTAAQAGEWSLNAPKILIVRHATQVFLGVWVEEVREFLMCATSEFRPLPVLMQRVGRIRELWGVWWHGSQAVILIDFTQLSP